MSGLINALFIFKKKNPTMRNTLPENKKSTCLSFVITNTSELKMSVFRKQFCGIREATPALLDWVIREFPSSLFRSSQNVAGPRGCGMSPPPPREDPSGAAFSSAPSEEGARHRLHSPPGSSFLAQHPGAAGLAPSLHAGSTSSSSQS